MTVNVMHEKGFHWSVRWVSALRMFHFEREEFIERCWEACLLTSTKVNVTGKRYEKMENVRTAENSAELKAARIKYFLLFLFEK